MAAPVDLDALHACLVADRRYANVARDALVPLPTRGIAHDHVRLAGRGLVARAPRFSQWGLAARAFLEYQGAAFARAAASGHTPRLHAVLAPGAALPGGALVVDFVDGRPPALAAADDMAAIAEALAALHELALPAPAAAAPLGWHARPLAATLAVIGEQAAHLDAAGLAPATRAALDEELAWARATADAGEPGWPPSLVATDAHPGNFVIDRAGRAWLVDLEKALYGAPPIDLAHATLRPSTGWDPDVAGTLAPAAIAAFYRRYLDRVGAARAGELAPWLMPLRRLTWLRTMTWLARWRAAWSHDAARRARDAALDAHISSHIARCMAPDAVAQMRAEWLGPDRLEIAA